MNVVNSLGRDRRGEERVGERGGLVSIVSPSSGNTGDNSSLVKRRKLERMS